MARIKYSDFDVRIEKAGDEYRVHVLNSLAGEANGRFSLPSLDAELDRIIHRLGHIRSAIRRTESPESEAARTFGTKLFNTVFNGEIRSRFDSAKATLTETSGLRLRINLSNAPELADIPWEFLYDPSVDRFLTLSIETPLVRYLDLPQPVQPLEITPPLEVLVMISSPANAIPLDVEREWEKLKEGLGDLEQQELVRLTLMKDATLPALQRQLRQGRYNIFHFIGHGGFDPKAKDGYLLFENETGLGRYVTGQELGTLLYDSRHSLRLAILNSCEGARASSSDPFAGTAQSLVQKGIPGIIAMQFEITDRAAIVLAHEFYSALADGFPVDAALAVSRQAIFAQSTEIGTNIEWGTPVLYMRSPDGQIFTIPHGAAKRRIPAAPTKPDAELAHRLEQLYSDGLEAWVLEEWEKASTAFQSIVELRPDYLDAASRLEEARRKGSTNQVEIVKQQNQLDELYNSALQAQTAQHWRESMQPLRQIQKTHPDYRETKRLLALAEEKLDAAPNFLVNLQGLLARLKPKVSPRQLLIGAAGLLVVVVALVGIRNLLSQPTSAGIANQVETVTFTSAPTSAITETQVANLIATQPPVMATETVMVEILPVSGALATATAEPQCTTKKFVYLRKGPGGNYAPPITLLYADVVMHPQGYYPVGFPAGAWVQVQIPSLDQVGWVNADQQFIECNIDVSVLPFVIVDTPPPPADLPTATSSNGSHRSGPLATPAPTAPPTAVPTGPPPTP